MAKLVVNEFDIRINDTRTSDGGTSENTFCKIALLRQVSETELICYVYLYCSYCQSWMLFLLNLSTLGCGLAMGYSPVILPQLADPNKSLYLNTDAGAWFGESTMINCGIN